MSQSKKPKREKELSESYISSLLVGELRKTGAYAEKNPQGEMAGGRVDLTCIYRGMPVWIEVKRISHVAEPENNSRNVVGRLTDLQRTDLVNASQAGGIGLVATIINDEYLHVFNIADLSSEETKYTADKLKIAANDNRVWHHKRVRGKGYGIVDYLDSIYDVWDRRGVR